MNDKEFMTVKDAATYVGGISKQTIRNSLKNGDMLQSFTLLDRQFIHKDDVKKMFYRYLTKNTKMVNSFICALVLNGYEVSIVNNKISYERID